MFFFRKILERERETNCYRSVLQGWFSLHCTALHCITLHHSYAMMDISEERQAQAAQHQSYWCHLLEEEIESPTINTYPNLFSKSKEEAEEEEEEEEEDSNGTCRRQYTCFQCNVTISLISSSSSPLLFCPHCYAEFWEELEPLSPSLSTTSNNPDLNSTPHINDVPEEDEGRYGNSVTVAVTEKKKKKSEKEWRRVIFHKIRTFFGFAI